MSGAVGNPTHFDVIDNEVDDSVDYGEGIRQDCVTFPNACNPALFAEVMAQPRKRAMVKRANNDEIWRFVGYAGLPIYIKTDYLVDLPEGIYNLLKDNAALDVTLQRSIRRALALAAIDPADAPFFPGQEPVTE